jgi:hypothetical protein
MVDRYGTYWGWSPTDRSWTVLARPKRCEDANNQQLGTITYALDLDDPPSWWDEGYIENLRMISHARQAIQRTFSKVVRTNQWCGAAERTLAEAHIGMRPHDGIVSTEMAVMLPPGTLLRSPSTKGSAVYIRDDEMENPSRTRRIAGDLAGHWVEYMEPYSNWRDVPYFAEDLDSLPVGMAVRCIGRMGVAGVHVKQEDGRWTCFNCYGEGDALYSETLAVHNPVPLWADLLGMNEGDDDDE